MDHSLPFYFFTLNERFRGEDDYPSFDECPQIDDDVEPAHHPLRLPGCGSIKEKMGPFLFQGEPYYLHDIEALFGNVCIGLFWDNPQCPITWS